MNMFVTLLLYTQAMMAFILAGNVVYREDTENRDNAVLILNMMLMVIWNVSFAIMLNSNPSQENLRMPAEALPCWRVFSV